MGLLDRVIRNGINNAVGNAVEQGVRKAVQPKVDQAAANLVNSAADNINRAAGARQEAYAQQNTVNQASANMAAANLGSAFSAYTGAIQNMANEAAKNMKICPSCGEGVSAEKKFCPSCGAKLPETTVAEGSVCPQCGKQNDIGVKFCSDCGAKLPSAIAQEEAARAGNEAVLNDWRRQIPYFPVWNLGGFDYDFEQLDTTAFRFSARFESAYAAKSAIQQYREVLRQNGFTEAGEYKDVSHLYKMYENGCWHCDTEHCFEGDSDCPDLYFDCSEPRGGFYYVKPEQKKQTSIFDMFK